MAISPGRRPRGRSSQPTKATVSLTSLIDAMFIILVFLIKSFDAEGQIFTVTEGMELPVSSAQKRPEQAIVVSIARQAILFEGKLVGSVADIINSKELIIPGLLTSLENKKELTNVIAEQSTNIEFKGEVIIEGDKSINYTLLQKVLYTCGQVGYSNFSLAVLKKEQ